MDDKNSTFARLLDHLVYPGSHLSYTARRSLAPVLVPHVANDDSRPFGVPASCFLNHAIDTAPWGDLDAAARMKTEPVAGFRDRRCPGRQKQCRDERARRPANHQ